MILTGASRALFKLSTVTLASLAVSGCMPPTNIFTPESGTHFDATSGAVVVQRLTASTALCYTTDGSEPSWNGGACGGSGTQRVQGPVTIAQIALTCGSDTGSRVTRTVKALYDWSGTPGYTQSAIYTLNCGGDDGGSGSGSGGGSQPQNLTLTSSADAYVNQVAAAQNFGFEPTLLVDLDPEPMHAYLRFNVPTLTAPVQSATLRLYGTNGSPNGPKIYRTGDAWSEGSLIWNNKPVPSGGAIADLGATSTGWVDIDVTSAVTTSGNLNLVLIPDDIDGYDFDSREGANPPQLVVVTGDGDSGGGGADGGASAGGSASMAVGETLYLGEYMVSGNGAYRFYLQSDGNLVLRDWQTRESFWSSGTHGQGGTRLNLQSDSNLVLYTDTGDAVWASNTVGSGANTLLLNNEGSLGLYQGNSSVWSVGLSGSGGGSGGGTGTITHIGTTETYDSDGENVRISRPSGSAVGDLLVLVLHRTDDYLPLNVSGWNRAAQCYKRDNGYDCVAYEDCVSWLNGNICESFGDYGRGGRDLAQAIFYKRVSSSEPSSYTFDMNPDSTGHPGWAILTALRGADTSNPIRDWANEGCDNNPDSLFPSVYGVAGDMVLLSQSFDDAIAQSKFNPPDGTTNFGYVSQSDEAGFLFGGILDATGETGPMKTHGDGGPNCKDALVSLTIRPQ